MKKNNNKLYILLVIGIICCYPLYTQSPHWKLVDTIFNVNPTQQYSFYYGLKCADSLNCMIWAQLNGAGGHYLRRTTDGGKTWKNVYMDSAYINFEKPADHYLVPKLKDIAYPSTKLFIAVGDSGLILRSSDNGYTWGKKFFNKNIRLSKIRMVDEFYGYLTGCSNNCFYYSDLKIFKTSNSGLNWIDIKLPDSSSNNFGFDILSFSFDTLLLLIQKLNPPNDVNILFLTNENWDSWDTTSKPRNTTRFHFINYKTGWFAGGKKLFDSAGSESWSQLIYRTDDRGKTWQLQRDTVYNGWPIKDIKFFDENFGIAGSGFSHVIVTTDGGKHWKDDEIIYRPPTSGDADLVTNIQIPSETTAYVIHDYRSIYKYTREITNVDENENSRVKGMKISPNPAGEYIEISCLDVNPRFKSWVDGGVGEIRIYNVLGECVKEIPPTPLLQRGTIRVDVSVLPAGVYFVRIGEWTGKFVKLKL